MLNENDDASRPGDRVLEIGGRLQAGPSKALVETVFARELQRQEGLFHDMSLVDIAYTLTGIETCLIPRYEGQELLAKLLELHGEPASFTPDAARGDLYTNREAWLAERCTATGWLGVGRARREATTSAFMLLMRSLCIELMLSLVSFGEALCRKAAAEKQALMPDYTYLQVAQPTTFGHYLLTFAYPLIRDLQRIDALYTRYNCSPLGCGSTNGSRCVRGRQRMAELLGFDGLAVHARDAMWQADLPVETGALLTAALINLSRLAEDLQVFCSEEFGLIELDDRHCRASKILPQKKNPFALSHIRGVANETIGTLTSMAALARTPSGQPDSRLAIYGLLPESMRTACETALLAAETLDNLSYKHQRGEAIIGSSWAMATDLAETLVMQCHLDFRSAHKLVGYLARRYAGQIAMQDLNVQMLQEASREALGRMLEIDAETLAEALDITLALRLRSEPGGAAPQAIDTMLSELGGTLRAFRRHTQACREALDSAERRLLRLAEEMLKS